MAATSSLTHAHPSFDGSFAVAEHVFADFEAALAEFVRASFAPGADLRAPDPTLAPDLTPTPDPAPSSPRRVGSLARVAIVVCFGAAAIWGWRAVASHPAQPATTAAIAPRARSAEHQRLERTARDLADLRQTVARLAAGQGQLTRRIRRLGAKTSAAGAPADKANEHGLRRVSAPAARRGAGHKPAATTWRQAARRIFMVSGASPPPRPAAPIQSEARLAKAPALRPPTPVPQP
jgi:hypothetical protein